jgi:hypothetical protein
MKITIPFTSYCLLFAFYAAPLPLKANDIPPVSENSNQIEALKVERDRLKLRARILSDKMGRELYQNDFIGYKKDLAELERVEQQIRELDTQIGDVKN